MVTRSVASIRRGIAIVALDRSAAIAALAPAGPGAVDTVHSAAPVSQTATAGPDHHVVAINFIDTTCAYACPLEPAPLHEVAALLGDRMGRDVFFVSITIDPRNDTPRVLKQYAETFRAGPGWTFLTGKNEDIIDLRKSLGLYMPEDEKNPKDQNRSLIVGNSLHNWRYASQHNNESYATAPTRLAKQSRGQ